MQTQPIMILGPTTKAQGISLHISSCRHIALIMSHLQSYVRHHPLKY
jgi:hypothetical protein